MSEENLRRFLDRINSDTAFREQAQRDPKTALEGFELSQIEQLALAAEDEDALRRLAGMDVSGHALPAGRGGGPAAVDPTAVLCTWQACSILFCGTTFSNSPDPADCRYLAPNA
jgi:hypothetical protein